MGDDTAIQTDYQNGISPEAAANAGQAAAQNGEGLAPQQSNESAEAYAQRCAAYNAEKNKGNQQQ